MRKTEFLDFLTGSRRASCMRCKRVHEHYKFTRRKLKYANCYQLLCDNCGTRMHQPIENEFVDLIKTYIKTPVKNKMAVLVILLVYPIALLSDLLIKTGEAIGEFPEFIIRWMEIWTGVRHGT